MPAKPEGDLTDEQLAEAVGGIAPVIGGGIMLVLGVVVAFVTQPLFGVARGRVVIGACPVVARHQSSDT